MGSNLNNIVLDTDDTFGGLDPGKAAGDLSNVPPEILTKLNPADPAVQQMYADDASRHRVTSPPAADPSATPDGQVAAIEDPQASSQQSSGGGGMFAGARRAITSTVMIATPARDQPDHSADEYDRALVNELDANPEFRQRLDALAQQPDEQGNAKGTQQSSGIAKWWREFDPPDAKAAKEFQDLNAVHEDFSKGIVRGALQGADQIAKTVEGAAAGISKATGLYKVFRSPEEQQKFLDWYSQPLQDWKPSIGLGSVDIPIALGQDRIDRWLGPTSTTAGKLAEGASQFAVGLLGATKILKSVSALTAGTPIAGAVGEFAGGSGVANTMAKGALADLTAFNPHSERLSNLIQQGPEWIRNPVTSFLQSKDDDSESMARVKQAFEGVLTNATIEAFAGSLKLIKAFRGGDKAAVNAVAEETTALATRPPSGIQVIPTEDGKFTVTLAKADQAVAPAAEGAPKAAPAGPTFDTRAEAEMFGASVEGAQKNAKINPGTFDDPEMVKNWREALKRYKNGEDPRTIDELVKAYGINVKYDQHPEEALRSIKAMVDVAGEGAAGARSVPRTWAETVGLANDLFPGATGDEVVQRAAEIWKKADNLGPELLALRGYTKAQAENVTRLAKAAASQPDNPGAILELGKAADSLMELHAYMTGTKSAVARTLNEQKIVLDEAVKATSGAAQEAVHRAPAGLRSLEGLSRDEVRSMARQLQLVDGDPVATLGIVKGYRINAQAAKVADPSMKKKLLDSALAYRIEAMLSGPRTHVANVTNNAMVALQRPVEYFWAGVKDDNPALRQQGADMLVGLFGSMGDSWRAAKRAFASGANVLEPAVGNNATEAAGALLPWNDANWLQRIARAPSRMLMSSDELFKNLNYRANMRGQILRQAREEGVTDTAEIAKRLTNDMQMAFTPDGGAVNPKALEYSRVATFQNDLSGPIGKWLQNRADSHPAVQLILPFVRTPVNIFEYAWQRTPLLNQLNKAMRSELAAGGEVASVARAKVDLGYAAWGTAAFLATAGQITGGGPKDPKLRRQWTEAGNQAYSVRVGDRWVSYKRGDPVTTSLGIVADLVSMSGEMERGDFEEHAATVMAAISSNIANKTFLQGITQFMDATSRGDQNKMQTLIEGIATSFVPNAFRQLNPDDAIHETRGMVDEVMSRLPGLSENLEPRRNLLGETVMRPPGYLNNAFNPFTVSGKIGDQGVQDELLKLGKAFPMPAETRFGGMINLTDRVRYGDGKTAQSPFDRMLQLMAEPPSGPSLREQLTRIMANPGYQKAPGENAYGPGGLKYQMTASIISKAQQAAWMRVLQEYPRLRKAFKQAQIVSGKGVAQGDQGVQDALRSFGPDVLVDPVAHPGAAEDWTQVATQ